MSLINEFLQDCILMDKKRTSDGEGGFITEWVEGAKYRRPLSATPLCLPEWRKKRV